MAHLRHATPARVPGSVPLKRGRCPADLREVQVHLICLAFAAVVVIAASGQAGGFVKYRLPNGEIGYASPGLVPEGATVETTNYEPDGMLSRPPASKMKPTSRQKKPTTPAKAAVTPADEAASNDEATLRATWAEKARASAHELERARRHLEKWKAICPGVEDRHAVYELPDGCSTYEKSRLDGAFEEFERRSAWAEDGLFDACRTSGECLPGYIR